MNFTRLSLQVIFSVATEAFTKLTFLLVCLFYHPVFAENLPIWKPGVSGDLAFQSSEFLRTTAYRYPDRIALDGNEHGAYSDVNKNWDKTHQGKWFIEEQRYAVDAIIAGVSYSRQDLIERGKNIFNWGFQQEKSDGSFDCPDNYHSSSFFIEAAAHAALLLQASPMAATNKSWVESIKPKLKNSAQWMVDPKNAESGKKHDAPYTHRNYLDGSAVGEVGILLNDQKLIEASKIFIREGLAKQSPVGFNPEKGGSDTSYHAVGVLFAMQYYTLVADETMRAQLKPMIKKSLQWLKTKTNANGTIDQKENTRTGKGQELGRNGTKKYMSYGSAYRAAYLWAMITQDPLWAKLAQKYYEGNEIEKKTRN